MVFLAHPRILSLKATVFILGTLTLSGCSSLSAFLFFPHQGHYQTPSDLGVQYETVVLDSEGNKLVNWLLRSNAQSPPKATVLYLHGNGENISTHMNSVAWLTLNGYDVFLLDYRGYGLSEGHSTLRSAMIDIKTAHNWLSTTTQTPLVIFGQSMGGALAIAYTANYQSLNEDSLRPFKGLASESAPADWPQVAREAMRKHWLTWLAQGPASLIEGNYDAEEHIGKLTLPIFLMHSKQDQIVAYHHFEQLQAAAQQRNVEIETYQTNGNHTQGFAYEQAREKFLRFLKGVTQEKD